MESRKIKELYYVLKEGDILRLIARVLPLVAKYLTHTRSVTNLKKCLFKDWYMEYRYACSPINPNFDHVC